MSEQHTSFNKSRALLLFFLCNAIGIIIFFVSITIGGKNTVVLDHICAWFRSVFGSVIPWITVLLMLYCLADTFFIRKIWKKNATELLMSAAKLAGLGIVIMGLTGLGAETFPSLFDKRIIPFVMDNLIGTMFTALLVAIFFMPFLVDYGLLEFCGVLLRPVMRPLFRTPAPPRSSRSRPSWAVSPSECWQPNRCTAKANSLPGNPSSSPRAFPPPPLP